MENTPHRISSKNFVETCEDVPENAEQEIQDFIEELEKKGYVGDKL